MFYLRIFVLAVPTTCNGPSVFTRDPILPGRHTLLPNCYSHTLTLLPFPPLVFTNHTLCIILFFVVCLISYIASLGTQMVKNLPAIQETQVRFLSWEDAPEKEMATHSSIPMCEFHGQRSLVGKQSMGSLTSEQKASGDFPGGSMVKDPPCNAEIVDKTPVRELRPHAPHSEPVCCNY